jgi:hypothetical protein
MRPRREVALGELLGEAGDAFRPCENGKLTSSHGRCPEACFRNALEISRSRGAKLLELRATMSLVRLLSKQAQREQARAMLAEIYNWFTEGFDTADLKDAEALLDELRA